MVVASLHGARVGRGKLTLFVGGDQKMLHCSFFRSFCQYPQGEGIFSSLRTSHYKGLFAHNIYGLHNRR